MTIPTPWVRPRLTPRREVTLTARQADILTGIAWGLTYRQIGDELYVTEDTVRTHKRALFRRLGAIDRSHAAALAMSGQVDIFVRGQS